MTQHNPKSVPDWRLERFALGDVRMSLFRALRELGRPTVIVADEGPSSALALRDRLVDEAHPAQRDPGGERDRNRGEQRERRDRQPPAVSCRAR